MKLQKSRSRTVGKTQYFKYLIILPPKEIEKAGWKENTELEIKTKGKDIILSPKKN